MPVSTACVSNSQLVLPDGAVVKPDTSSWFKYFDSPSVLSFHFQDELLSYTARKEKNKGVDGYWFAYVRISKILYKCYIGRRHTCLTLENLLAVSKKLQVKASLGSKSEPKSENLLVSVQEVDHNQKVQIFKQQLLVANQKIEELSTQLSIETVQTEVQSLKLELETLRSENQRLHTDISNLQIENQELRKWKADSLKEFARLNDQAEQLKTMQEANLTLHKDLDRTSRRMTKAEEVAKKLRSQIEAECIERDQKLLVVNQPIKDLIDRLEIVANPVKPEKIKSTESYQRIGHLKASAYALGYTLDDARKIGSAKMTSTWEKLLSGHVINNSPSS